MDDHVIFKNIKEEQPFFEAFYQTIGGHVWGQVQLGAAPWRLESVFEAFSSFYGKTSMLMNTQALSILKYQT